MKVGIVGYANTSGLGQLIFNLKEMISEIAGQFIVSHKVKDREVNYYPAEYDYRSPYSCAFHSDDFMTWFNSFKPGVIILLETPFNWEIIPILKKEGCKIVFMPMLDSVPLSRITHSSLIDCWIVCNQWSKDLLNNLENVFLVGAPINTKKFYYKTRGLGSGLLLHHAGYAGTRGRKGTQEILTAFEYMKKMPEYKDVRLKLYSQTPLKIDNKDIDYHIGDEPNQITMFEEGDVFLAPSKREGVGMHILEAMASGFPVLTTNYPPMNEYVNCPRLLVNANITINNMSIDIAELSTKMGSAALSSLSLIGEYNRKRIEKFWSYDAVRPVYKMILESLV